MSELQVDVRKQRRCVRTTFSSVAVVTVLLAVVGATVATTSYLRANGTLLSKQRAPLYLEPLQCNIRGSNPLDQLNQSSAAGAAGPVETSEFSANRLIVKFSEPHDPFRTRAKQRLEAERRGALAANESLLVEEVLKEWKSNQPVNGWFPASTSVLPAALPESLRVLVERVFYSVFSGVSILEVESHAVMQVVKALLEKVEVPGLVEFLGEDRRVVRASGSSRGVDDDPRLLQQYHLEVVGVVKGHRMGRERPPPWQVTQGDPAVVVALLDSGVDLSHPDLVDSLWVNSGEIPGNGVDDDGNGYVDDVHGINLVALRDKGDKGGLASPPLDDNGHGTHLAGIIAAKANKDVGVVGIAPLSKVMVLKVLDAAGWGTLSDIIQGIHYSLLMKAAVSCNGYGSTDPMREVSWDVRATATLGQLFVAPAGNQGQNHDRIPMYPAHFQQPNLLAVAATDRQDCLAINSNYGKESVHLAAPGVSVMSTTRGHQYAEMSGSSQAASLVAGTAALMFSALRRSDPNWLQQGARVRDVILKSVDRVPGMEELLLSAGRLNAAHAVAEVNSRHP